MKALGIYFDNIHSFYDLNLFLAPFVLTPAEPKTNYVDVPGGDGSIDLTEAHGEVRYKDRTFTFTFTVNPSDDLTFDEKVTQISNLLNGKRCNIILDRDEDYYWEGRCIVDNYAQDRNLKQIVIKAIVRPYKLKKAVTVAKFDLTADEQTIFLQNSRKSVSPEITCTDANTKIVFGSKEFTLDAGTYKVLDIYLKEGSNALKVSGSGTITFTYQEAEL